MPIRACANCSSDRLVFPKGGGEFTCDDCQWRGTPNEYGSWSAWQEFRVAAKASASAKAPNQVVAT